VRSASNRLSAALTQWNALLKNEVGGKRNWLRYRSDFLISPTTTQVRQADQAVAVGVAQDRRRRGR